MPEIIKIYTLGNMKVEWLENPPARNLSKRDIALLTYLLLVGQPVSKIKLADLFYPNEVDEARSIKLVQKWLGDIRLRHPLLQQCLPPREDPIRFHEHPAVWIDCMSVKHLCQQKNAASLQKAFGLFNGVFLAGYTPNHYLLDGWLRDEREYWHTEHVALLTCCVKQRIHLSTCLAVARRLLREDTTNEALYRSIMLLLARKGDFSQALHQYKYCKRVLLEELAIAPSAQTQRLADRILVTGQLPRRLSIPTEPNPLIGRNQEVADITKQLQEQTAQLITITGIGGIGKTRLALAVAAAHQECFLEGVYFVDLSNVNDISDLFLAIAKTVQIDIFGNVNVRLRVEEYLYDKEILFVFDNFEQLIADGGEQVLADLSNRPQLKIIVTSREQIHLPGVHHLFLMGLHYKALDGQNSLASSAYKLFMQRFMMFSASIDLNTTDELNIERICKTVQGMPLAIELAARAASALSIQEVADKITHTPEIIDGDLGELKSQSIRTTFDLTWQRLAVPERKLFSQLCILQGVFSYDACTDIAFATPPLIKNLVNKSLLRFCGHGRYTMHPLLRQYGLAKLGDSADQASLSYRYIHYYLNLFDSNPFTSEQTLYEHMNNLSQDWHNIQAAWEQAVDNIQVGQLSEAAFGIFIYLEFSGQWQEGYQMFLNALDRVQHVAHETTVIRAHLSAYFGWFSVRIGAYTNGIGGLQSAITQLSSSFGLDSNNKKQMLALCDCRWCLGLLQWYVGEYENARINLQSSLQLSKQYQHAFGEFMSLKFLEFVARSQGNYEEAVGHMRAVHKLAEKFNEPRAVILTSLWHCYTLNMQGQYDESLEQLEKWLPLASQQNDRIVMALGALIKGQIAYAWQEIEAARQLLADCLDITDRIGEPWLQNICRCQLAELKRGENEFEEARDLYRDALHTAWAIKAIPVVLECCFGIVSLLLNEGDHVIGVSWLQTIREHSAATYDLRQRANVLFGRLSKENAEIVTNSIPRMELEEIVEDAIQFIVD